MSSMSPPRWQDLLTRYLQQAPDRPAEAGSEVELYQAQPALGLDLATAWKDALLPGVLLDKSLQADATYPDSWPQTRSNQWAAAFPCCVGLAPQFLQQIHALMQNPTQFFQARCDLKPAATPSEQAPGLTWLGQLGAARAAGDFNRVTQCLDKPASKQTVLVQNERAAQAWLRGERDAASKIWNLLPGESPVIAFNQALAALPKGDTARGRERLSKAAAGFPETTGWHHLAELYRVALGD
jgi:hypothetical protein